MGKRLSWSGLLVAASMFTFTSAQADQLIIGAYPANPPWEYKTADGEFEGYEIDVAREVAKRLSLTPEFQDLGFQAIFAATNSGRVDFGISSISVTPERLKNQAFTQPYYDSDGTVVGKSNSVVKSLDDLKGKVLGVVAGSTGDAWAKQNAKKLGIVEVKSYNTQQDLLMEVQNGRIDGGAGELAGFQYAMTKMPGLQVLVRIPTGERFAMLTKKNHPLLEKVNDAISAMKEDGTMAAIHKKWFNADAEPETSTIKILPLPQAE